MASSSIEGGGCPHAFFVCELVVLDQFGHCGLLRREIEGGLDLDDGSNPLHTRGIRYALHSDWQVDRVVSAIRSTVEIPGKQAVADVLLAAIAKQNARDRAASRKRKQEEAEAASRLKEEVVVSGLRVELRALRATDPGMSLLTAVEYITSDPAHRVALYRCCSIEDQIIGYDSKSQGDSGPSKIGASADRDLGLLERRAKVEGFPV